MISNEKEPIVSNETSFDAQFCENKIQCVLSQPIKQKTILEVRKFFNSNSHLDLNDYMISYSSNGDYFSIDNIYEQKVFIFNISTQKLEIFLEYTDQQIDQEQLSMFFSNNSQHFIWLQIKQIHIYSLKEIKQKIIIPLEQHESNIAIRSCNNYLYISFKKNQDSFSYPLCYLRIIRLENGQQVKEFSFERIFTPLQETSCQNVSQIIIPYSSNSLISILKFKFCSFWYTFCHLRTIENGKILGKCKPYRLITNYIGITQNEEFWENIFKLYNVHKGKLIKKIFYDHPDQYSNFMNPKAFFQNNDLIIQQIFIQVDYFTGMYKYLLFKICCFRFEQHYCDLRFEQLTSNKLMKKLENGVIEFYIV